jgi:uncharacterized lipoprotein NlpE involved in copper resistance
MKKLPYLFLAAIFAFAACNHSKKNSSKTRAQQSTVSQQPTIRQGHRSNSKISGEYMGTLPCADCPGIQTTLTFEPNHKVKKTALYMGSNNLAKTAKGNYIMKNDSLIVVNLKNNKKKEFYKIKSDTSIVRLNSDQKEV